jgi:hypothetical protein
MNDILVLVFGAALVFAGSESGIPPFEDLPACQAVATSSQADWRVITRDFDDVVVIAPPSFKPFDRGVAYRHGGAAWKSDGAIIEIMHGIWGVESFPHAETACKTTIDGVPTMYLERRTEDGVHILAWFKSLSVQAKKSEPYEPVVKAWSSSNEDLLMLRAVVLGVKRAKSHGAP